MGGNVARTARVAVLQPRPADVVVLLVDGKRGVGEPSLELVRRGDTGYPCSDADDAHGAFAVDVILRDDVWCPGCVCGCREVHTRIFHFARWTVHIHHGVTHGRLLSRC